MGVYFVMSVMQGGCGLPFLARPIFDYLVRGQYKGISVPVSQIPDPTLRFIIEKVGIKFLVLILFLLLDCSYQVNDVENDDDIKVVFAIDEGMDLLLATGFRKAVCNLTTSDRPAILSALMDYHLMAKTKAEMDQFREGLTALGFLDTVRKNPEMWESFFVHKNSSLTAGTIVHDRIVHA